ncbi:ribose 5-phosphate isomerase B [Candidatus Peregrinibacteria bacterium]|nr:ribose 5-phosphate isomerase B [Candidatus Peregrinibacteria bacterium]
MFGDNGAKKLLFIGSDHAGFQMKGALVDYLKDKNFAVTDLGCFSEDPCDYPDIGREVGEKIVEHKGAFGIALCGSGIGISIAANKLKGIRCVLAVNEHMAETARRHNDANVLALGARENSLEEAKGIVDKFLTTDFESDQERHVRRVDKLSTM